MSTLFLDHYQILKYLKILDCTQQIISQPLKSDKSYITRRICSEPLLPPSPTSYSMCIINSSLCSFQWTSAKIATNTLNVLVVNVYVVMVMWVLVMNVPQEVRRLKITEIFYYFLFYSAVSYCCFLE